MKKTIATLSALLLLLGLSGCGTAPSGTTPKAEPNSSAPVQAASVGDGLEISLATVIPDGTPIVKGITLVSETLNDQGFDVKVFPAGQLGSLTDVMDRCMAGENTIMTCDPADLADLTVPDMAIVQAPFLYDSWEDMDTLFNSAWWQEICAAAEDAGMKIIASNWSFGDRHILTTKPVSSLADLAGMKIRVPNNTNFVQTFTSFGAVPTPLALSDVYSALNQGTIDGLENPLSDIYQNKFQEVAKYCVADAHIKQDCLIICGMDFWNTLTEAQQEAIVKAAQDAGAYERDLLDQTAKETRENLEAEGVVFTSIDRAEFVQAAEAYYEGCSAELGWSDGLRDTVMEILGR